MLIQVNTIQTEICSAMQKRIRSGEYKVGEKLSENLLATEFNCSRMPVREALKHLEQDGLVVIQPKSGTYVREYSQEEISNALEIRAYLEERNAKKWVRESQGKGVIASQESLAQQHIPPPRWVDGYPIL